MIYDFLVPDFGISLSQMRIAFSGDNKWYNSVQSVQIYYAKTNKRSTPVLECTVCNKKQYAKSYRVKRLELQEV
ncbi:hypothetical protein ES703_105946 [subsurface metagenome]